MIELPQFKHPVKIGVLGSGSGSNLQAIIDAIESGALCAEVALVLSDNPSGYILERAKSVNIPTSIIDCGGYATKFPLEAQIAVAQKLQSAGVQLVCLAGFMRLVKQPILEAFPHRVLNIHPSLLPSYPGLKAWEQAIEDGAKESGCTVHYVDAGMDTGEIINQAKVSIAAGETAQSLHRKIQELEHVLYPETIKKMIMGSHSLA